MLAKPYFRTCQRFRMEAGTGRNYLALWTLQSAEAFKTAEYTSDWGFFEWAPYIVDWSRDLFDGRSAEKANFAVPLEGALHAVTFDGMSADEAKVARAVIAARAPDMTWLPVAGLDRHTPLIGLRSLPDPVSSRRLIHALAQGPQAAIDRGRIHEAIYRPISACAYRQE